MRLFTGIEISPDVMTNLQGLLERLRPTAEINWSPPQNLHITTKFIGEWLEERLPELKAALDSLSAREPSLVPRPRRTTPVAVPMKKRFALRE